MWHLDTNAAIAFLNGKRPLEQKFHTHLGQIAISSLAMGELLFGARNSARPDENLARLREFVELVEVVDFDLACAETYSGLRLNIKKKGRPIGKMDLLISSVAVTHNATLVTNNLQHFRVIEGLRIEDWLE